MKRKDTEDKEKKVGEEELDTVVVGKGGRGEVKLIKKGGEGYAWEDAT